MVWIDDLIVCVVLMIVDGDFVCVKVFGVCMIEVLYLMLYKVVNLLELINFIVWVYDGGIEYWGGL